MRSAANRGWQTAALGVSGAGPSVRPMRAGSMEPVPPVHTPIYEHKKHRLSRLLDKLAVQLNNNNNYPTPSWLVHDTPQTEHNEAPLDLSLKSPREGTGIFSCHACAQRPIAISVPTLNTLAQAQIVSSCDGCSVKKIGRYKIFIRSFTVPVAPTMALTRAGRERSPPPITAL
ncbi:unnamed protein product [Spodoptera exigua]|nr:unnamed protein product [Spodoptera exigua]